MLRKGFRLGGLSGLKSRMNEWLVIDAVRVEMAFFLASAGQTATYRG